jgi:energy-coupling factor transporter ATP-binding protein EcfA2
MTAPRLVVIVGPTGAGKTALALALAAAADGEIVSCDSQQVYRGMDLGTGKASAAERARAPHHLLDVIEPDDEMTAARFVALADAAIADVAGRGRAVIVCGGTGPIPRCAPSSTRSPPTPGRSRCGGGWPRSIPTAPRGSIATIASAWSAPSRSTPPPGCRCRSTIAATITASCRRATRTG